MGLQVKLDLNGDMAAHVLEETGEGGAYSDAVAYLRDLILRDMAAVDAHQFRTVKEHLQEAFSTPESAYVEIDCETFLREMKSIRL